jgi:acetyl-CoA acetyltransferase
VLLAAGEKEKALAAAQRVMSEKPMRLDPAVDEELARQWGGYYFHLALILDENGDAAAAATAWQEAKKLGFTEEDVFKMELRHWKRMADKFN